MHERVETNTTEYKRYKMYGSNNGTKGKKKNYTLEWNCRNEGRSLLLNIKETKCVDKAMKPEGTGEAESECYVNVMVLCIDTPWICNISENIRAMQLIFTHEVYVHVCHEFGCRLV